MSITRFRTVARTAFVLIAAAFALAAADPPADFKVSPVAPPFKLADAKGKFVVLHFLLKTECPFCLKHTHEYATRGATELPNTVQLFLKPDELAETLKWMEKLDPSDPAQNLIYQDPGGKWATKFGIPGGYKFHGQITHYPALILIDPDGKEVFRYVGKNNTDRYPFDKLAAKVAELSKK